MKLIALTLETANQEYKAAKDTKTKARIAMRWFERNADPTLEEIQRQIDKEDEHG